MRPSKFWIIPLLLMVTVFIGGSPALAADFDIHAKGTIYRVIDGDTMIVTGLSDEKYVDLKEHAARAQSRSDRDLRVGDRFNDRYNSMMVRIGNIDTPESVHPDASRNTPEGRAASDYVKDRVTDLEVEVLCWEIGNWGRPICSVFGGDLGEGFDLGVHLIVQGYAEYVDRFGVHPYWPDIYEEAAGGQ